MKTYIKLLILMALVVVLSVAFAFVLQPFLPFTFYKVIRRLITIFAVLGGALFWKILLNKPLGELGLGLRRGWVKDLLAGFSMGIGAVVLYVTLALMMKLFKFELHRFGGEFLLVALWSLPAALLIGLVEEFFFRGFLLQTFLKDMKWPLAVFITTLAYALVHIKAPFQAVSTWEKLLGLFILGLALAYAYLKTRSLYLPIGLHAGLIYAIRLRKFAFIEIPAGYERLFGDKWLVGGMISWVALFIIIFLIKIIPFSRSKGK
ncbi:MAG: type II CAAX endopeptidase family protein [Candidatus Omnitrophota bacterium]